MLKTDCEYSFELPRQGSSNEYPQSIFFHNIRTINIYPCKPQFYYIKVGFKAVKIILACFRDANVIAQLCFCDFNKMLKCAKIYFEPMNGDKTKVTAEEYYIFLKYMQARHL